MAVERIKLPGFGLPVNYRPKKCFPTAVLDWSGTILTVRELKMMAIMNKTTNKPDWDQKVFDDTIAHKWRQEALATEGTTYGRVREDARLGGYHFILRHCFLQETCQSLCCSPFSKDRRDYAYTHL